MAITRRQFLKYCAASAAALGLSELELFQLTEKVMATLDNQLRPKIVWLQGQACNGDVVSVLNLINSIPPEAIPALTSASDDDDWDHTVRDAYGQTVEETVLGINAAFGESPTSTFDDVLIDIIDLKFHPTACAPAGALAFNDGVWDMSTGSDDYFVIVEGTIPCAEDFNGLDAVGTAACTVGDINGEGTSTAKTMYETLRRLCDTTKCQAVIALGTCAAFGGIPAAKNANEKWMSGPNKGLSKYKSTGARSVSNALALMGGTAASRSVINISGCPIRPDDLFLVVAGIICYGLGGVLGTGNANITEDGRVKKILGINIQGDTQHYHCSRKSSYAAGRFATSFAQTVDDEGRDMCLALLGCKGQTTYASCQRNKKHQWNPLKPTADVPTGYTAGPIHDTKVTDEWPSLTNDDGEANVPANSGPLGVVTNEGGTSCVKKGHPCIGCKEKGFPDRFQPLVNYNN